ncbi:MAG: PDZ domain-containing protein, partial [Candidatus Rokuibacteriota bacterium]
VVSRTPRPWLGLYTESVAGGVAVAGLSPLGPARSAGLRAGDVIVQLNGRPVGSREEFYRELWQSPMDEDVRVTVRRAGGMEAFTLRPMDRYRFYRTSDK